MSRSFPTEARVRLLSLVALVLVAGAASSCRQDMHDQEKLEPLEASTMFPDGRASRHPVEGTVARGDLEADHHLHRGSERLPEPPSIYTGEGGGEPAPSAEPEYRDATTFPFAVTRADLARGRERYDIHCAPCHSRSGHGDGMVVRRGLRQPPSFHIDRLREQTPGYLYDVITRGFGAMPAYGNRIALRDRWAIVAYMRALQLSQNARLEDVPEAERQALAGGGS